MADVTSQHTIAELDKAISAVIGDAAGANPATSDNTFAAAATIPYWESGPKFGTVAGLFASPQSIGATTPAAGAFTTLTTTGSVGFGVASPAGRLEVEDAGLSSGPLVKITADDATPWALVIGNDTYSTSDTAAGIRMLVTDTGEARIVASGTGSFMTLRADDTSGYIAFNTGGTTDRGRIDSSGNFILGATSTSSNAQLYATKTYSAASGTDNVVAFIHTQSAASTGGLIGHYAQLSATHTSGTVANIIGHRMVTIASGAGGTTTNLYGYRSTIQNNNATATITNAFGLYIDAFTKTGTIINPWAIYSNSTDPSYLAGALRIGVTTATTHAGEVLRVHQTTGSTNAAAVISAGDSGSAFLRFVNSTTGSAATDGFVVGLRLDERATVWNYEATATLFATNNTERMRISASGPVLGIGTADLEAWSSSYGVIEFSRAAVMGGNAGLELFANAYLDAVGYKYKVNNSASNLVVHPSNGISFLTAASGTAGNAVTWSTKFTVSNLGNVVVGSAALATTDTDGFLYITSCAGAPTGVPTAYTGRVALQYDSTNNKLYVYDGGWIGVTLS